MKRMYKSIFNRILLFLAVFIMAACSGGAGGDTATISISINADSVADKSVVPIDQLRHVITLTGPTGKHQHSVSGTGTFKASVVAGTWRIDAEAFYDRELYASGSATAEVKAGRNTNVIIYMNVVWAPPGGGGGGGGGGGSVRSGIISVTITPPTTSIEQGQTGQFTATVSGTNDTSVNWSLSGGSGSTNIYPSGNDCVVFVDISETIGTPITITATSNANPGRSAGAAITVTATTATDPLFISLGTPGGTLTPLSTERTTSFAVTVGGFSADADANNVKLLINVPGLTFSGHEAVAPAILGSKTFTVNVTLEDTHEFDTGSTAISVSATGYPLNYYIPTPGTTSLLIRDGRAATASRQILVNSGNIQAFNAYAGTSAGLSKHYFLTAPVTLTSPVPPETSNWTSIGGYFTGSFDGNNQTITNLTISGSGNQGMFSSINGGTVKNLGLLDVNITGTSYVGSITANLTGSNALIESCYSTGSVTGGSGTGGLVGLQSYLGSTIKHCYFKGSVSSTSSNVGGLVGNFSFGSLTPTARIENCYYAPLVAADKVTGNGHVGGVAGTLRGIIVNCYSTGEINSTGQQYAGGIVGYIDNGAVENCYSTSIINNAGMYGGGIAGRGASNTLRNLVALNPGVSGYPESRVVASNGSNIGGVYDGQFYTRRDMPDGIPNLFGDKTIKGKDGLDIPSAIPRPTYTELNTLWTTPGNWNASSP